MARAAAAGKHLFVEKPFTLTKASAEQSIAAVRKAGLVVSAGHNRRFLPSIAELQRRIETGALGQTLHAEATFSGNSGLVSKPGMWRAGLADNPAGGMTAMGIHMVDTLIDLFGSIDEVYAQSFRQAVDIEIDDTTSILLRFENGKSAYLGTFNATGRIWSLRVFGTKGWLEIRHQSELIFRNLEGEEEVVDFGDTDIERAELEAFADTVANGADYPVSDAEAIHGVAVLEAIAASAAQHEPVKVA
jgi:predicted dehydrogenase